MLCSMINILEASKKIHLPPPFKIYFWSFTQYLSFLTIVATVVQISVSNSCLVCTSSGGPVDKVSWLVNDVPIAKNDANFIQSQIITNYTNAEYQHFLCTANSSRIMAASYTCTVTDVANHISSRTMSLSGKKY